MSSTFMYHFSSLCVLFPPFPRPSVHVLISTLSPLVSFLSQSPLSFQHMCPSPNILAGVCMGIIELATEEKGRRIVVEVVMELAKRGMVGRWKDVFGRVIGMIKKGEAEEEIAGLFACLHCLFKMNEQDEEVKAVVKSEGFRISLGYLISNMLKVIQNHKISKGVRILTLEQLFDFLSFYDNCGEFVAGFLPGIVSCMHRILQDAKVVGPNIFSLAIRIWSVIISSVLNQRIYFKNSTFESENSDIDSVLLMIAAIDSRSTLQSPNTKISPTFERFKESQEFNLSWFEQSKANVYLTMLQFFSNSFLFAESWKIRMELAQAAARFLENCSLVFENAVMLWLESLLVLSLDDFSEVASVARNNVLQILVFFGKNEHLRSTLTSTLKQSLVLTLENLQKSMKDASTIINKIVLLKSLLGLTQFIFLLDSTVLISFLEFFFLSKHFETILHLCQVSYEDRSHLKPLITLKDGTDSSSYQYYEIPFVFLKTEVIQSLAQNLLSSWACVMLHFEVSRNLSRPLFHLKEIDSEKNLCHSDLVCQTPWSSFINNITGIFSSSNQA